MALDEKIVVAMSGGVDSSVAAMLLGDRGYEVEGVFMRTGVTGGEDAGEDAHAAARRVADSLGIPLHVRDFEADFRRLVHDFLEAYRRGRTPNPCVLCNSIIK